MTHRAAAMLLVALLSVAHCAHASGDTASISTAELDGFSKYPPALQSIIRTALHLATLNLRYQFGSCDPADGGMDCSGTIYYLLQGAGVKDVPRQSDEMCEWVMRRAVFHKTPDAELFSDAVFVALRPGDLVFWSGTWQTSNRSAANISHVMLYIGRRKADGKPVLFGASDGRSYDGQRRNGVSVFDFKIPQPGGSSAIYGYGPVPGLR